MSRIVNKRLLQRKHRLCKQFRTVATDAVQLCDVAWSRTHRDHGSFQSPNHCAARREIRVQNRQVLFSSCSLSARKASLRFISLTSLLCVDSTARRRWRTVFEGSLASRSFCDLYKTRSIAVLVFPTDSTRLRSLPSSSFQNHRHVCYATNPAIPCHDAAWRSRRHFSSWMNIAALLRVDLGSNQRRGVRHRPREDQLLPSRSPHRFDVSIEIFRCRIGIFRPGRLLDEDDRRFHAQQRRTYRSGGPSTCA